MEPLVRHDISYKKSTGDSGKSNLIQVISGLKGLSNTQMLTTLPNNQTGFEWKVFSIGRSNSIQVSCSLTIEVIFYIFGKNHISRNATLVDSTGSIKHVLMLTSVQLTHTSVMLMQTARTLTDHTAASSMF